MISIIPQPVHIELQSGHFNLNPKTVIVADGRSLNEARQMKRMISALTEFDLEVCRGTRVKVNSIELRRDPAHIDLGEEGYLLTVTAERVSILAPNPQGLYYGAQTLLQLFHQIVDRDHQSADTFQAPCVTIRDYPRFSWRGAMLDVSRHFMPSAFLMRFIDLLAMHKMNIFHCHLTDDQGWRIEIKKYPKLTEVGAWRKETLIGHRLEKPSKFDGKSHGGFYSQDTLREMVDYAAERHIKIVPEIDMPGHTQAAIASYPSLGNTVENIPVRTTWGVSKNILNPNEETIQFMQEVLEEVLQLFPGTFFHIGGDEVDDEQWKNNQSVQARMKELKLKDEKELYGYFIHRMADFLRKHHRRMVGWGEILEGKPAKDTVVMSWRSFDAGIEAAKIGNDVVMAPSEWTYFDTYQTEEIDGEPLAIGGYLPLEKVYSFEPVPESVSKEEAAHILGAQGQIWTEYMPDERHVEYMTFPRLTALAEVLWTPKDGRNYENFKRRLQTHLPRLKNMGVNFHPGVMADG